MPGDRSQFNDREEIFAQDLNSNNALIYWQINERHLSFLRERKSYILKGLDTAASTSRGAFNLKVGIGIDADGNFVDVREEIQNTQLADPTEGAINVITLSYSEIEHTDQTSIAFSPISEDPTLSNGAFISPRSQRGKDVNDPTNQILPTRIYSHFTLHVETLAAYNALDQFTKDRRIKIRKLVTPPNDGLDPGFVDPIGLDDPEFPTLVQWNMPPGSVPFNAVAGLDEAITDHQREAHIPFIFGDKSDTSFLASINITNPIRVDVNDVDTDKAYYVAGKRFERGALTILNVDFNFISDPSGTYTIVVRKSTTNTPFLAKVLGAIQPFDDMPIATVVWDATLATLTNLIDARNFLSVRFDSEAFDLISPLIGLFGTGYFVGGAQQLKVVNAPGGGLNVLVSPGYGIAKNGIFGRIISLPSGEVLPITAPDAFPKTEQILGIQDSGDTINSIVYVLNVNGAPPHAVRNVVVTVAPSFTLIEGSNYEIVDATLGQIRFFFGGPLSPGSDVTVTYEYGLPRLDLIGLSPFGEFEVFTGISAQFAVKPTLPAGYLEWAIIDVPELGTTIQLGDILDGAGYQPLTKGFIYGVNNRLGLPELFIDLTDPNGVTGEQIPSTDTLTINQRFAQLEAAVTGVTTPKPFMAFRWEVTMNQMVMNTFDFIPIARLNKFTDQAKDLGTNKRYRFSIRYRDNIPNSKPLMWHLRVVRQSNNAVIQEFSIPSNNAIGADALLGLSHFATPFYEHADTDKNVRIEMCINDSANSKTNAGNPAEINDLDTTLLSVHVEVWNFPVLLAL